MSKIGVFIHVRTLEPVMIADLDTLLIALHVELTDRFYGGSLSRPTGDVAAGQWWSGSGDMVPSAK
jgi:hypothetical protein